MNKENAKMYLRGLMSEINDQCNRGTATPYYFDIRHMDEESRLDVPVKYGGNVFFTAHAADSYIKQESHNLPTDTFSYCVHARRNPQLQLMLEAIGALVGVPHERK